MSGKDGSVEPVRYAVRDHLAIIVLNRPDSLNAVDAALATALGEALERADDDDDVRVVVITGEGRAFCAGMDLKAFASGASVEPIGHPEWGFAGVVRHPIDKPVIAAVNGAAFGGGAEIALSADLIVADERAQFALPEIDLGLFAAAGGVMRLGQQLPQRVAAELVLTARRLPAAEAARWGLVNRVAPEGTSLQVALELAAVIAAKAPLAVQASVRLLRSTRSENTWTDEPWAVNEQEMVSVWDTQDAAEGARAFIEKRSPNWLGR